jgi:hypothetical protein
LPIAAANNHGNCNAAHCNHAAVPLSIAPPPPSPFVIMPLQFSFPIVFPSLCRCPLPSWLRRCPAVHGAIATIAQCYHIAITVSHQVAASLPLPITATAVHCDRDAAHSKCTAVLPSILLPPSSPITVVPLPLPSPIATSHHCRHHSWWLPSWLHRHPAIHCTANVVALYNCAATIAVSHCDTCCHPLPPSLLITIASPWSHLHKLLSWRVMGNPLDYIKVTLNIFVKINKTTWKIDDTSGIVMKAMKRKFSSETFGFTKT